VIFLVWVHSKKDLEFIIGEEVNAECRDISEELNPKAFIKTCYSILRNNLSYLFFVNNMGHIVVLSTHLNQFHWNEEEKRRKASEASSQIYFRSL
jgi:hypothetical protein